MKRTLTAIPKNHISSKKRLGHHVSMAKGWEYFIH